VAIIGVPGFYFAGVACGIKKTKKDLALVFSEKPATAAALFTTNRIKAAPIVVGLQRLKRGKLQALVINSGNANACTGRRGLRDAERTCEAAAKRLGIAPDLVLPSSTGVIGVALPMDRILTGINKAAAGLSRTSLAEAAEAILTTDRFIKVASARCKAAGRRVTVVGFAKGAGMIAPRMATMLAYVLTDAVVERRFLRGLLKESVEETFNCVTVDGDTSTNDTVVALANGLAGNRILRRGSPGAKSFAAAVGKVMRDLAIELVRDGEGASRVAEIYVEGARSRSDARKVAFAVAGSQLVKTALFGADPNFGRIMAAVGYAGVPIKSEKITIAFDRVVVVRGGVGLPARKRAAARVFARPMFQIRINLGQGRQTAKVWTSDLSHEYVRINSAYTS
jgi:glutamate N-acetyltransferase/amino-acid N-acetyltransferase